MWVFLHLAQLRDGSGNSGGRLLDPTEDEDVGLDPLDNALALSESEVRAGS